MTCFVPLGSCQCTLRVTASVLVPSTWPGRDTELRLLTGTGSRSPSRAQALPALAVPGGQLTQRPTALKCHRDSGTVTGTGPAGRQLPVDAAVTPGEAAAARPALRPRLSPNDPKLQVECQSESESGPEGEGRGTSMHHDSDSDAGTTLAARALACAPLCGCASVRSKFTDSESTAAGNGEAAQGGAT